MKMKMALVCFFLLFFSALPAYISHSSSHSDEEALLSFKRSLSLDPHNSLLDWSLHQSFCNWTGINCSSHHQRVVSLNLTGMYLQGPISPFLGNLSFLRVLSLKDNSFQGQIPSQLGRLFRLRILYLHNNHLTGAIPWQFGKLLELQLLVLGRNQLTGEIPSSLSNCTQLQALILYDNQLSGNIPWQFGKLLELQHLFLWGNQLTGEIPSSLSNCTQFLRLELLTNQLRGNIPWQFGKLSKLKKLLLWDNQLTGEIPSSLSNCTQLQVLELSKNQLSGKVPLELSNLHQLVSLRLWGNHLMSEGSNLPILTALNNCSSLEVLDLSLNPFTGILPSSISHLSSHLSIFLLHSNKIEGNIPSGISNLTMLTFLALFDNHLNGTIPSSLGQLPHLERLYLGNNDLYGNIPKSLGQVTKLGLLSLSENMLSGKIPDSLGVLPQLRQLSLDDNQLSGNIPTNLGNCQTLELVDLSHNKLRGNMPPELASLKNIQFYFNISNNFLQGSILAMSTMVMVQAIDVSLNNFSSIIPDALSSCANLQYLNLSHNSFGGPIPVSLTNLKNLQEIDLSSNKLSGAIPMAFQEMKTLQHINLSLNRLTGEVPKGGVFATLDESAVMGNLGLCGKWIKLQACSNSQHKQLLVSKKVMIPIMIGLAFFIMSFVVLIIYYRRRDASQATLDLNIGLPRTSYEELVHATGGFSQTNLLGVGSFGSVYSGILNNGTNIAVKVLNLQDEHALQSFHRECNVLKRVRHRNVIKIISTCFSFDFKALVFPLMSNGSLERWLYPEGENECRLNLSDRLRITKEIAQGMAYLHHHCFVQVIHCDLKPNNVLLGDDMTPYITDFGITKILFGNSMDSLTSTNTLKGSIGYIAPEYGLGGKISTKGDVYSYGILLLEMLTRRRPTDDMLVEGVNLPKWVGIDFPNKITEVVDKNLLRDVNESDLSMVLSCLTQFIQVGLACTRELPEQRPNMMQIVERLEKIIGTFLGTRSFQLPVDISPFLGSTSGLKNNNSGEDENWSTSTS